VKCTFTDVLDLFDIRQYQGESRKDFLNRFGARIVRLPGKDEEMFVHAFKKGVLPRPFSESLIRSHPATFAEIRRRAVAHTAGRTVHRVLVDQGSSADVMFLPTFEKLQLSPDQLRPYGGCLYGFASDQVEVRGYIELRTTFTDGLTSRTEKIRYFVVNAPSAYNILLRRPTLNRTRVVPSTRHMKVKLPSIEGMIINVCSDQKEAKKCYENSL